jgi:hypothetical protein
MRPRCFRTISAKKLFRFKAETFACKRDAVATTQDRPPGAQQRLPVCRLGNAFRFAIFELLASRFLPKSLATQVPRTLERLGRTGRSSPC